jgi:hypothetical protein
MRHWLTQTIIDVAQRHSRTVCLWAIWCAVVGHDDDPNAIVPGLGQCRRCYLNAPLIPVPAQENGRGGRYQTPVHGPETLYEHLTRPLDQGGHFLDPQGSMALITDHLEFHKWDHEPNRWWSDALMHTHAPEQAEGWHKQAEG